MLYRKVLFSTLGALAINPMLEMTALAKATCPKGYEFQRNTNSIEYKANVIFNNKKYECEYLADAILGDNASKLRCGPAVNINTGSSFNRWYVIDKNGNQVLFGKQVSINKFINRKTKCEPYANPSQAQLLKCIQLQQQNYTLGESSGASPLLLQVDKNISSSIYCSKKEPISF